MLGAGQNGAVSFRSNFGICWIRCPARGHPRHPPASRNLEYSSLPTVDCEGEEHLQMRCEANVSEQAWKTTAGVKSHGST